MAGIVLTKGGRINLTKTAPELKRIRVGLSWAPNPFDTGADFDLDASCFVCKTDANGDSKLIADEYLVFYGSTTSPDNAVKHSGDNKTGAGDGDDESVIIDLAKLNPLAEELSFIVTIYESDVRKQNFGQVPKSGITLYNDETGEQLAHYSLEDDFSTETAVQFGSLVKKDGHWTFKAVGAGYKKGLADFVLIYGGTLA